MNAPCRFSVQFLLLGCAVWACGESAAARPNISRYLFETEKLDGTPSRDAVCIYSRDGLSIFAGEMTQRGNLVIDGKRPLMMAASPFGHVHGSANLQVFEIDVPPDRIAPLFMPPFGTIKERLWITDRHRHDDRRVAYNFAHWEGLAHHSQSIRIVQEIGYVEGGDSGGLVFREGSDGAIHLFGSIQAVSGFEDGAYLWINSPYELGHRLRALERRLGIEVPVAGARETLEGLPALEVAIDAHPAWQFVPRGDSDVRKPGEVFTSPSRFDEAGEAGLFFLSDQTPREATALGNLVLETSRGEKLVFEARDSEAPKVRLAEVEVRSDAIAIQLPQDAAREPDLRPAKITYSDPRGKRYEWPGDELPRESRAWHILPFAPTATPPESSGYAAPLSADLIQFSSESTFNALRGEGVAQLSDNDPRTKGLTFGPMELRSPDGVVIRFEANPQGRPPAVQLAEVRLHHQGVELQVAGDTARYSARNPIAIEYREADGSTFRWDAPAIPSQGGAWHLLRFDEATTVTESTSPEDAEP